MNQLLTLLLEHISTHCLLHVYSVKMMLFVISFGFYVHPLERVLLTQALVNSTISVKCLCIYYCFIRFFWIAHGIAEYLKVKGDKLLIYRQLCQLRALGWKKKAKYLLPLYHNI